MNEPAASDSLEIRRLKRADLHCHSRFSVFKYFKRANTRDCYNAPEDVYRIAKERGMSFVTLTDHDSIDGALYLLNKYPDMTDFFIGEEVETYFPETGQRIHVGVWGLDEAQHREIQRLRPNIRELVPYMKSQRLIFGDQPPLPELSDEERRGALHRRAAGDVRHLRGAERRDGVVPQPHGPAARGHGAAARPAHLDGRRLRRAHAQARGEGAHGVEAARRAQEFLENVRNGNCFAWGAEMRFRELVADIYLLIARLPRARRAPTSAPPTTPPPTRRSSSPARLASIPTAISGLPAAITSLNYLKQIVVTKGLSMRFEKLVEEIRPGLGGER